MQQIALNVENKGGVRLFTRNYVQGLRDAPSRAPRKSDEQPGVEEVRAELDASPVIGHFTPDGAMPDSSFLAWVTPNGGQFQLHRPKVDDAEQAMAALVDVMAAGGYEGGATVINFLSELDLLSRFIPEQPSGKPLNILSDLEGRSAVSRKSHRMMVFDPDGAFRVFPQFSEVGPMIVGRQKQVLIGVDQSSWWEVQTFHRFEKDIAPKLLRRHWKVTDQKQETRKNGKFRIIFTNDSAEKTLKCSFAKLDQWPHDVLNIEAQYDPMVQFEVDPQGFASLKAEVLDEIGLARLRQQGRLVEIAAEHGAWSLAYEQGQPFQLSGVDVGPAPARPHNVRVFAADFLGALKQIALHEGIDRLTFKLDPAGILEIAFDTGMSEYRILLPTVIRSAQQPPARSTKLFSSKRPLAST